MMTKSVQELSLVEEAADWIVQLSADDPETREYARQQFEQWKSQSSKHQKIAKDIERYLTPVQQLSQQQYQQKLASAALRAGLNTQQHQYLKATSLLLLLCGFFWGGYSYLSLYPMQYLTSDLNSKKGQWRTEVLADGSQIQLGSGSAVNIDFTEQQRTIHLLQGEIYVDVAKDASRPFVVSTDQGNIRALGTAFSVEQHADEYTQLKMLHSKVEATTVSYQTLASGSYPQQQVIYAGQQVQLHPQGLMALQPLDIQAEQQKWTKHQLVVENKPLTEVLDILNRNYKGKIVYQAQDFKDMNVNAVLMLNQTTESLDLLQMALPELQVQQVTPYFIYVSKK